MDWFPLNSQTAVELINVPMRRKICIKVGKLGADDFLLFSVPEESLCKAWEVSYQGGARLLITKSYDTTSPQ